MPQAQGTPRRRLLELLVGIAVVHGVALALYYGLDVPHAPPRTQRLFAWVWMGVTLAVVLVGQRRLKRARLAARRGVSPGP
jgi:hypothetical protein